jgi:hypothetical protein
MRTSTIRQIPAKNIEYTKNTSVFRLISGVLEKYTSQYVFGKKRTNAPHAQYIAAIAAAPSPPFPDCTPLIRGAAPA